jgi:hypothetical protein
MAIAQQIHWTKKIYAYKWGHGAFAMGVDLDFQNNIYVSGHCSSDLEGPYMNFVKKFTSQGTLIWEDTIPTPCDDIWNGGIVCDRTGNTYTFFRCNTGYIVKYDPTGQLVFYKSSGIYEPVQKVTIDQKGFIRAAAGGKFDSLGNCVNQISYSWDDFYAYDVVVDSTGNLFSIDSWTNNLEKRDSMGTVKWTYHLSNHVNIAADVSGNSYAVASGYQGANIFKWNASGQLVWTYTVPIGGQAAICGEGNFIYLVGQAWDSTGWLGMNVIKFDSSATHIWTLNIPYSGVMSDLWTPTGIIAKNNQVYICGWNSLEFPESFLININELEMVGIPLEIENDDKVMIFPTPVHSTFNLKYSSSYAGQINIKIRNLLGNCIYNTSHRNFNGSLSMQIDLDTSPGIYILEISGHGEPITKKLVVY